MSDHTEAGRLDERTAERLLDGAGGPPALHTLLAAAAAPGRAAELAGEDAAVAAFRSAPPAARPSRLAAVRRFLTAKVIALVGGCLLVLTGGVAYATGHFPGMEPAPAPSPTQQESEGGGHDSTPATQYSPSPLPSQSPSVSSSSSSSSSTSSPSARSSSAPGREHGKPASPGKSTQSPNAHSTSPPPRGPDNANGNGDGKKPSATPTKSKDRGADAGVPMVGAPDGAGDPRR
ncbi:hypothetical protein [Actinomadura geliboluensis]|uniref:hypothetical protein n=1 Tax=Actinomadura geliboluensis TaxID=882440 RepID=UPI0036906116